MKSEDEILTDVTKSGRVDAQLWPQLREYILRRLDENLSNSFEERQNVATTEPGAIGVDHVSENQLASRISSYIESFDTSPPFTIQRIAELILFPSRYHSSKAKYLRALDRTLMVHAISRRELTVQVSSTVKDFPPVEPSESHSLTEPSDEFPLFSPIPWLSAVMPNERYSSPPTDAASAATTIFPISNGVTNSHAQDTTPDTSPAEQSSPTQVNTGVPPPIDAVDIGIVPENVARAVQEGGPPPRSPEDLEISRADNASDENLAMDVE